MNLGVPELVLILIIALLLFGANRLPEIGRAVGKALREFKKATREIQETGEPESGDEVSTKGPGKKGKKSSEKKV